MVTLIGGYRMTRKDFEAIAKIIKDADKAGNIRYPGTLAYTFADYLETTNPRFDRDRFIAACID